MNDEVSAMIFHLFRG